MVLAVSKSFTGLMVGDVVRVAFGRSCREQEFTIKAIGSDKHNQNRWIADVKGEKFLESADLTVSLIER